MTNAIESMPWGIFEGEPVTLWRLVNANGLELDFTDWGGRLVKALVPDRSGHLDNVTLGWPTLDDYVAEHGGTYYGALVGRYGNRIGKGRSPSTARRTRWSSTMSRAASPARSTAVCAASRCGCGSASGRSTRRTRWASFSKSPRPTARAAIPAT